MKRLILVLTVCMLVLSIAICASATDSDALYTVHPLITHNDDGSFSIEMEPVPYNMPFSIVLANSDDSVSVAIDSAHDEDLHTERAFACAICGSRNLYKKDNRTEIIIVGAPDTCYIPRFIEPIYCENDHVVMNDEYDTPIRAHSFGPLNSDGYTVTCRTCEYTTRN